jgi:tRNA threonylcarbamoyladenosine biosynthesis protein TsaB
MIERTLAEAGFDRTQIERIAIGLGPGSSTGIRTAIALAQGWQLGRGVEIVGVSSLEVLAAQLQRTGHRGLVHLITDAQRREYHVATFQLSETRCEERRPLRLAAADEVRALLERGEAVWGPDLARDFPQVHEAYPTAGDLARLAARALEGVEAATLEPIHLRRPDFVKAPPATLLG